MLTPIVLAAATGLNLLWPASGLAQDPDYRFSRAMRAGQVLAISNIDGSVTVSRAPGATAEVLVTKRVIKGDGSLVKAVLQETADGIKVCTLYLEDAGDDRDDCERGNRGNRRRAPLEVEMTYEVRLPSGVELAVGTVDGDIVASDLDAPSRLSTVDGGIRVSGGLAPERIATVDGDVDLDATGRLPASMRISTVDGNVRLALPAGAGFTVNATTVDGSLESDFPITVRGKWGPRAMHGSVGDGRTELRVSTVDGDLEIRRR